jgi:hypothetical protein
MCKLPSFFEDKPSVQTRFQTIADNNSEQGDPWAQVAIANLSPPTDSTPPPGDRAGQDDPWHPTEEEGHTGYVAHTRMETC